MLDSWTVGRIRKKRSGRSTIKKNIGVYTSVINVCWTVGQLDMICYINDQVFRKLQNSNIRGYDREGVSDLLLRIVKSKRVQKL